MTKKQIEDYNPVVLGMVDRRQWQWWDSVTLENTAQASFFQVPINQFGTRGMRKTKLETNAVCCGSFPAPTSVIAFQIGFDIEESDAMLDELAKSCWFEFRLICKILCEGRLWRFRPGSGFINPETGEPTPLDLNYLEHRAAVPKDDMDALLTKGFPVPPAGVRMTPTFIMSQMYFAINLYFPTLPPPSLIGRKVKCTLDTISDFAVL